MAQESEQESDKLRAVIVGCGDIGLRSHAKCLTSSELSSRVELVGISRTEQFGAEKTAREIRERYGVDVRAFGSYTQMYMRTKSDIVVISNPAEHHYLAALDAFSFTGLNLKAFFIEKPFIYDYQLDPLEQARGLAKECPKRGVYLDTTVQLGFVAEDYFLNFFDVEHEDQLILEFPSSRKGAREKWIDMGCHLVEMIEQMHCLAPNWCERVRVKLDGQTFSLSGNILLESFGGILPVDIKIGEKGGPKKFGYYNKVWEYNYDVDRDGYVATFEGEEVSFIPDPMMQRIKGFVDNVWALREGRLEEEELERSANHCYRNLERMLAVLR